MLKTASYIFPNKYTLSLPCMYCLQCFHISPEICTSAGWTLYCGTTRLSPVSMVVRLVSVPAKLISKGRNQVQDRDYTKADCVKPSKLFPSLLNQKSTCPSC